MIALRILVTSYDMKSCETSQRRGSMKLTMVIADDERLARQSEEIFVKREFPGVEIVGTAPDGVTLKEMLESLKPDLAIVDIRMPGLTGLEAIELAKAKGLKTHFIISTAYSDFEYVRSALNLKTDGYLLKPCKREEHYNAIANMCMLAENEKKEQREIAQVRNVMDVMKPSLENELLLSVISGEPDECAFEAYCGIREIDFQYGCMLILLAQDKKIELDVADYSRSIERILAGVCSYFCTMTGNSIVIAMILPGELGKDHLKTWAQETALTVVEELEKDKGQKLLYSVGSVQDSFKKMSISYRDCREELTGEETDSRIGQNERIAGKNEDYVLRANRYLKEHFREDIALDDCAGYVGVSSYYLSHLLKDATGRTFVEHLSALRLNEAKRLCKDEALTTAQIANLSGYSTPHYFYRVFKKATGMTVSEFRKQSNT